MRRALFPALAAALFFCASAPCRAQTGLNVLVVANDRHPDATRIAERYAALRGVPDGQVLHIQVEPSDEIERAAFDERIQAPLVAWLGKHAAHDRILYIVLVKGIPLRIRGTPGRDGTTASVDSELTLLYRRLTGAAVPVLGPVPNPYYLGERPIGQAARFSHEAQDVFLVTRLDGFSTADVLALVERGAAPSAKGVILLDQKAPSGEPGGNHWLKQAADWMIENGFAGRVELETTGRVLRDRQDVLGYFSWGSNDPAITGRQLGLGFVPGALAGLFVSTDARTFAEPPADWTTGPWTNRARFFANSPQSLTGDLVREGVTGVAGHVAEPYLDATIRPQILFPAYLSGMNLAESFYLAMPSLGWQAIVIGDPLCAPFTREALPQPAIDKGPDPQTGLPAFFSARRLKVLEDQGVKPEAARALVRAEALAFQGDRAATRQALLEAVAADPRLRPAQMQLAAEYEASGEHDLAIERYRAVLALSPRDAVSLNNLAYSLAVRKGELTEALGLAERAFALAPNSPSVADTLGWIHHLQGNHAEASRLLAHAVRLAPGNAEIRLHAAAAHAAHGLFDAARTELQEALAIDPGLATRDEAKAVRALIK